MKKIRYFDFLDVPAFASLFFIICSFSSISPESVL